MLAPFGESHAMQIPVNLSSASVGQHADVSQTQAISICEEGQSDGIQSHFPWQHFFHPVVPQI